jgi:hypothetical protein
MLKEFRGANVRFARTESGETRERHSPRRGGQIV